MGTPLGESGLAELKNVKNVALVTVSATVPAAGARQGDRIDCTISAISAKSLQAEVKLLPLFKGEVLGKEKEQPAG